MREHSIPAHIDGTHILLDEPIELEPNAKLVVKFLPNDDRTAWLSSSARKLQDAYSDDEPDYPLDSIVEANAEYDGR